MDENWRYERFPLSDLLAIRRELKIKRDYAVTCGHGDCLEEQLTGNVPTSISSSSSASLVEFQESPESLPSFCDDQSMWNRGDYEFNIDFLKRFESNRLQYITCQKEKHARNNTLLAHIKNLLLQELENCGRKKTELDKVNTECDEYKRQINENLNLQSKLRFEEEEKLNKNLKEQKRKLIEVRRGTKIDGSDHHNTEDFSQHKRLQEKEHAFKGTHLRQVSECSFTTTDKLEGEVKEQVGEKFRLPCMKKNNEQLKSAVRYEHAKPNGVCLEKNHVAVVLPQTVTKIIWCVGQKLAMDKAMTGITRLLEKCWVNTRIRYQTRNVDKITVISNTNEDNKPMKINRRIIF